MISYKFQRCSNSRSILLSTSYTYKYWLVSDVRELFNLDISKNILAYSSHKQKQGYLNVILIRNISMNPGPLLPIPQERDRYMAYIYITQVTRMLKISRIPWRVWMQFIHDDGKSRLPSGLKTTWC